MSSLVAIGAADWKEYHGGPLPVEGRLYANKSFRALDGTFIQAGRNGRPDFYQRFDLTLNDTTIRIEPGDAYSTSDSDQPDVTYTFKAFDAKGRFLEDIFHLIKIYPQPNPATWEAITEYSKAVYLKYPPTYMSSEMFENRLATIMNGALKSSALQIGVTKLDVNPDDLTNPIAVGANSPTVTAKASPTSLGRVKLDVPAADPNNPIAVGINSPAVTTPASPAILGKIKVDVFAADPANPIAVGTNSPLLLTTDTGSAVAVGTDSQKLSKDLTVDYGNAWSAAIAANPPLLTVTSPVAVNSDTTVPVNIQLDVHGAGLITVAAGKTLNVASLRDPGNRKIFVGPGNVRLGRGSNPYFNTAWFTGPATGADITYALNQFLASCAANLGGRIIVPSGTWLTAGGHTWPSGTMIEGSSKVGNPGNATEIKLTAASVAMFRFNPGGREIKLSNITLNGDGKASTQGLLTEGTSAVLTPTDVVTNSASLNISSAAGGFLSAHIGANVFLSGGSPPCTLSAIVTAVPNGNTLTLDKLPPATSTGVHMTLSDDIVSGIAIRRCTFLSFTDAVYLHGIAAWQIRQVSIDNETVFAFNTSSGLRVTTSNSNVRCDADFFVGPAARGMWVEGVGTLSARGNEFAGIGGSLGTPLVKKLTVSALDAVTGAGLGQSTVTAAGMIGTPPPLPVYVPLDTTHNTAAKIAAEYRKALARNPSVASFCHVFGDNADIYLMPIDSAGPDGTFNFTIEHGGATGVTNQLTAALIQEGIADGAMPEAAIDITGPYVAINLVGTSDEAIKYSIKHNFANEFNGNIQLNGCLVQGRLAMLQNGRVHAGGCAFVPKTIRDAPTGSGSLVILDGCTTGRDVFVAGAYHRFEQRAHNISDVHAANTSSYVHETGVLNRFTPLPWIASGLPMRMARPANYYGWAPSDPWLAVLGNVAEQRLLRIGTADTANGIDYYYDFYRDVTGWLHIDGSQADPAKGLKLNCPLEAQSINLGGATVLDVLSVTATLDFDLSGGSIFFHDLPVTVTGAALGDCVFLGVPHAAVLSNMTYFAWVSAANTVTVRAMVVTTGSPNPPSASFRVTVVKF